MLSQQNHGKSSSRGFPWWIVWIWSGVLASLFLWLWKQRSQSHTIQPVSIDLSFLRHPAAPIAEPARPTEVLIASPAPAPALAEEEPERAVSELAQPDDLTVIGGIGPKIAGVLRNAGIDTFNHLAQTGPDTLREILQAANLYLADPTSWPGQAELAAKGEWIELKGYSTRRRAGGNS